MGVYLAPYGLEHCLGGGSTQGFCFQFFLFGAVDEKNDAVQALKQDGYKVFAVEQVENSISLEKFDSAGKIAVVFGNEVTGVEQSTIALCDGTIEIPQLGMKHSLNIATAAGVVLWELVRTRIA